MCRSNIYPMFKNEHGSYLHLIYNIKSEDSSVTGFLCFIDCNNYHSVHLVAHEQTYPNVVSELINTFDSTNVFEEPVFLLSEDQFSCHQEIKNFINEQSPMGADLLIRRNYI